ncbi:MAG: endonuclease domain-containing protein [Bacteroidota bacterium]
MTEARKLLRRGMPKAEKILWSRIRKRQILGDKFRRQYSVGPFVIDFYCPALKLAIEIDGENHFTKEMMQYDKERQEYIEAFGIEFLRFTNQEIFEELEGVISRITERVLKMKERRK